MIRHGASWTVHAGCTYHHQKRIYTVVPLPPIIWADVQGRKHEGDVRQICGTGPVGQVLRALLTVCIQLTWGHSVTTSTHRMECG